MRTIAPINYIELVDIGDERVPVVAGTPIAVGEIATMYFAGESPIEWIVENFEVLSQAQVHAALSYYLDHQTEIDTQLERASRRSMAQANATLTDLIAKAKARRD